MKLVILLSTYNGEKYLKKQLDSLFAQSTNNFQIIVRDDGSTDGTLKILKSYNIILLSAKENIGTKQSFSTLLAYALENTKSTYFMFCDQDDIWEENKIEKTLKEIQELELRYKNIPLLVHTNLKVLDQSLNVKHDSFWKYEYIDPFTNSCSRLLLQNTVTGCTAIINRKLVELALPIPNNAIMHDWWLGLVASKFGKISHLKESTVCYRQHTNNTVGARGFGIYYIINNITKKDLLLKHIQQAKVFLDIYRDTLDKDTIQILEDFSTIESKSFWQKRKILLKHKLLKQGFIRNMGLLFKI